MDIRRMRYQVDESHAPNRRPVDCNKFTTNSLVIAPSVSVSGRFDSLGLLATIGYYWLLLVTIG